jgi:hypothetical protein
MKLNEVALPSTAVRSWEQAIADAQAKGLHLYAYKNRSPFYLSIDEKSPVFKALERVNIVKPTANKYTVALVKTPKQYRDVAARFVAAEANPEAYAKDAHEREMGDAYDDLRTMQGETIGRFPHGHLQLFVPRPAVHQRERQLEVPEALDAPVMMGRGTMEKGYTKPVGASLWTSTLQVSGEQDGVKYYTSPWLEYAVQINPKWTHRVGHVYKINPSARILTLDDDHDAAVVYKLYRRLGAAIPDEHGTTDYGSKNVHTHFPWNDIAKHWDGIHHSGRRGYGYGYGSDFFSSWDVESTAWFDTDVLQYMGRVRLRAKEGD